MRYHPRFNCGPGPVCFSQPPDLYGSGRLYLPWALAAQAPGQAYLYGATDAGVPIPVVNVATPTPSNCAPCLPWLAPRNPDPIGGDVVGAGVFQPKAPLPWDRPTLGPDHGRWALPGYIAREPDQGWWVSESKDEFSGARQWITNMVSGLGGGLGYYDTPGTPTPDAARQLFQPQGYMRSTAHQNYGRSILGLGGMFDSPGSKVALVAGLGAIGIGLWYFLSKKTPNRRRSRRRRNRNARFYAETHGGLLGRPTEAEARALAEKYGPRRGGWARVWEDVERGTPMKLVGRYTTTKKGLTRKMNGRSGRPMYAPSRHVKVFATVSPPGQREQFVVWTGRGSVQSVVNANRKAYPPGTKVAVRTSYWVTD